MSVFLKPILVLLVTVGVVEMCSLLPGQERKDWSVVPMMSAAPYVVLVEGVDRNETNNIATLKVLCILKVPDDEPVPDEIYTQNVVVMHSCLNNPEYKLGEQYIFALDKSKDTTGSYPLNARFDPYEPNFFESVKNMYEATTENIDDVFNICGMALTPSGSGTCPAYNERGECSSTTTKKPTTTTIVVPIDGADSFKAAIVTISSMLFVVFVLHA